jgi:hypothetical protein
MIGVCEFLMADLLERAAHYRRRARHCRCRATEVADAEHRQRWLELAEGFKRLAEETERLHVPE